MKLAALAAAVLAFAVPAATAGAPGQPLVACSVPPTQDRIVAWAPQGIVFRRRDTMLVARPGDRRAAWFPIGTGIGVLSPDGRRWAELEHDGTIATAGSTYRVSELPAWSPDSQRLAYVDRNAIHVARPGTDEDAIVAAGTQPAWSPDGTRLAYVTPARDLAVVGADGSSAKTIWHPAGVAPAHPQWSADGARIAVAYEDLLGGSHVDTVAPDGSGYRTGRVLGWGVDFAWSPRGREIAYTAYNGGFGPHRVGIVDEQGHYHELPVESMGHGRWWVDKVEPHWSPDGRTIAFTMEDLTLQGGDGPPAGGRAEIWLADTRTFRERRFTYHCESPIEGARIVYGTHLADTILVRDGIRESVLCGSGRDTVIADRRDRVARDCEVVRRR